MSDSSQIPPGNRPPAGRVFRPFAGGAAEQGSQSPSAAPDSRIMDRRPMQPRRPFIGGQSAASNRAAASPAIDVGPALDISPATDVSAATAAAPAPPQVEAARATTVERATWLTIVEEEPAVIDFGTDLIGESAALGDALEVAETSALPLELPAIAGETFELSFAEPTFSAPEQLPVVTREVPAFEREESDYSATPEYAEPQPLGEKAALGYALETGQTSALPLELRAVADETFAPSLMEPTFSAREQQPVVAAEVQAIEGGEPAQSPIPEYAEPDPLEAPLFIAPNGEPAADSLIDEVDAAFITAGLPSAGAPSDEALRAAAALEEVARRLRAGDLDLQHGAAPSISSEESALATVLAALLANR